MFRLRPIERYIYNFVYFIFHSHVLHKHQTEIIKMKRNIGALQFCKKLKIRDALCYYFAWKRQLIKCMHLCAGHIFCTFFSFLFYVVRTKKMI